MAVQATEKRLWRSRKDAFAGGVCAGIAEYFDVDAIVVRTKNYWFVYKYSGNEIVQPNQTDVLSPVPHYPGKIAFLRVDALQVGQTRDIRHELVALDQQEPFVAVLVAEIHARPERPIILVPEESAMQKEIRQRNPRLEPRDRRARHQLRELAGQLAVRIPEERPEIGALVQSKRDDGVALDDKIHFPRIFILSGGAGAQAAKTALFRRCGIARAFFGARNILPLFRRAIR